VGTKQGLKSIIFLLVLFTLAFFVSRLLKEAALVFLAVGLFYDVVTLWTLYFLFFDSPYVGKSVFYYIPGVLFTVAAPAILMTYIAWDGLMNHASYGLFL
jgi:hypothetical protein